MAPMQRGLVAIASYIVGGFVLNAALAFFFGAACFIATGFIGTAGFRHFGRGVPTAGCVWRGRSARARCHRAYQLVWPREHGRAESCFPNAAGATPATIECICLGFLDAGSQRAYI